MFLSLVARAEEVSAILKYDDSYQVCVQELVARGEEVWVFGLLPPKLLIRYR